MPGNLQTHSIPLRKSLSMERLSLNDTLTFRPDTEKILDDRLGANSKDPDALFTLAALRTIQGKFEEALNWIHQLEDVDPKYPGLWRLKAKIYDLKGDAEMAAFYWKMGCDGSR